MNRVDTISAEDPNAYREGMTGSHFAVGGMDHIMIPLHASSDIREVLRLSTAALRVCSNLM